MTISHTICAPCEARLTLGQSATLVVSRHRAELRPILQDLLRGSPEIEVVVDRRAGERRAPLEIEAAEADRRAGEDRRRGASLILV